MRRITAFCIILWLLVCSFSGCSDNSNKSETAGTQSQPVTDSVISTDDISFISSDGSSVYRIVRPDGDPDATHAASNIYREIKGKLGIDIKSVDDSSFGEDVYEILIGQTNRPESDMAKQYLINNAGGRYSDFIIATIGKKIVIYGMSSDALVNACAYFSQSYLNQSGVKGGIVYCRKSDGEYIDSEINGVKLAAFNIVKQRFNESYLTQLQIEIAQEEILSTTGYFLNLIEDHRPATEYEIIIGDADREGVSKISNREEYVIKIAGKKVYLNGGGPEARAMAVSEFSKMLQEGSLTDSDSVVGLYSEAVKKYDKTSYYTATWKDDFDFIENGVNGVDTTKWNVMREHEEHWIHDVNGRDIIRTPNVFKVEDGLLKTKMAYDDTHYYGFKLRTNTTMTYRYGITEMSAILPHGNGFWISLWANSYDPTSDSAFMTEINIVEMFGNSSYEAANCHGWLKKGFEDVYETHWKPQGIEDHWALDNEFSNEKKYTCPEGLFNDGFHTFSYYWTEDECTFACDGNVYFSINLNEREVWKDTLCQPLFLILSEVVCPPSSPYPFMEDDDPAWEKSNNFTIDYVHIYQLDDGKHTLNLNPQ